MCLKEPQAVPEEEKTTTKIGYKIYRQKDDGFYSSQFGYIGQIGETLDADEIWLRFTGPAFQPGIGLFPYKSKSIFAFQMFQKYGHQPSLGFHVLHNLNDAKYVVDAINQLNLSARLGLCSYVIVEVEYTNATYSGHTFWDFATAANYCGSEKPELHSVKTDTTVAKTMTILRVINEIETKETKEIEEEELACV